MFENISRRFSAIFDNLRHTGVLRLEDIENALREIRITLLEADVSLAVVKGFISDLKEQALGQQVIKSITPDQKIIKMVNDRLVSMISEGKRDVFEKSLPRRIMVVGLQGAGKTTASAKLANILTKKKTKVMMATCDVYRPAAVEQLHILSEKIGAEFFKANSGIGAVDVVKDSIKSFNASDCHTIILDTAGRLHTDDDMMKELVDIQAVFSPDEVFLVVDSMTGQDAVKIAVEFADTVKLTGIIMTRMDADARGGAAISIGKITGTPIVFLSTGEKLDDIEPFDAERIVKRILGMGDVVALVEQAEKAFDKEETQRDINRLAQGKFNLNDLAKQMRNLNKLGGISSVLGMIPGLGSLSDKLQSRDVANDNSVGRQLAIIYSMTKQERQDYKIIKGSRKRRIAAGSGTTIQEVNKLLKGFEQMLALMKQFKNNRNLQGQMKQMLKGK